MVSTCPLPPLGVGIPVVVDDVEGAESVGAVRSEGGGRQEEITTSTTYSTYNGVSTHTWKANGCNEASGSGRRKEERPKLRRREGYKHRGIVLLSELISCKRERVWLTDSPSESLIWRTHDSSTKCKGLGTWCGSCDRSRRH